MNKKKKERSLTRGYPDYDGYPPSFARMEYEA